jgi:hypothetical protein
MDKLKKVASKITGGDRYQSNLLGESLPDLLRRATNKTLPMPDEYLSQQVRVDARALLRPADAHANTRSDA